MKVLQLLIAGADAASAGILTELAGQNRFAVMTAGTDEAAVEKSCRVSFDAVIAGNTLSDEAVRKLKAVFKTSSPGTVIILQAGKKPEDIKQQLNELYLTRQRERLQHIAVNDTTDAKNLESRILLN